MCTNSNMIKIEGVIPAAGRSSRMGTDKLDLSVKGKKVLERVIESMYDFCTKIIVVVRIHDETVKNVIKAYPKVVSVYNDNHNEDMKSSIKAAFEVLEGDRIFLTPGDYPLISKDTYKKMLQYKDEIVVPSYNKEYGHPLFLSTKLANEFLTHPRFGSLREFVFSKYFLEVPVDDPGTVMDMDTAEDYYNILKKAEELGL